MMRWLKGNETLEELNEDSMNSTLSNFKENGQIIYYCDGCETELEKCDLAIIECLNRLEVECPICGELVIQLEIHDQVNIVCPICECSRSDMIILNPDCAFEYRCENCETIWNESKRKRSIKRETFYKWYCKQIFIKYQEARKIYVVPFAGGELKMVLVDETGEAPQIIMEDYQIKMLKWESMPMMTRNELYIKA